MKVKAVFFQFIHLLMILLVVFCPQNQLAASVKIERVPAGPQNELEAYRQRFLKYQERCPEQFQCFSFDDVLDLIDEIEYGEPEESRTDEELDEINQFIVFLAEEGILPGETDKRLDLASDIQELMNGGGDNPFRLAFESSTDIVSCPSVLADDGYDILLARGYFSKKWKSTKDFVKNHKKEILIGAAIVVAVTVVVVAAVVISSAAAASAATVAAGTVGGAQQLSTEKGDASYKDNPLSTSSSSQVEPTIPPLEDNMVSFVKEHEQHAQNTSGYPEIDNVSYWEQIRDFTSYFAHEVIDAFSQVTEYIPQSFDSIREMGASYFSSGHASDDFLNCSSSDSFRERIVGCHEAVDEFFSTDFSPIYNQEDLWNTQNSHERGEAEAFLKSFNQEFTTGWIPPPGFGKLPIGKLKGRIPVTQPSSIKGWRVGEDIRNLTSGGRLPTWSTARRRYWKNTVHSYLNGELKHPKEFEFNERNISRMKKGLAPQRLDEGAGMWESMELHHAPPQREGGLFDFIEVWPAEHAKIDSSRRLGKK